MGVATDILALRDNHLSSVTRLLAALDRVREARTYEVPVEKITAREFYVGEAVELVLTNVAAHAADALIEQPQPLTRKTRRASPSGRKNRRFDLGSFSRQRVLFA